MFSGNDIGQRTGVVRVLDVVEELLQGEHDLRGGESFEPKEDMRDLGRGVG